MLTSRRSALALLAAGSAAAVAGCGVVGRRMQAGAGLTSNDERTWARVAWRYVENNTDAALGLVNGTDRSPVFTASNAADHIASLVCARELGVVADHEFDLRLSRLLGWLAAMDLSQGLLPNKAYSATTGKMVGFDGKPDDIGWSAVDIGRLLLWLEICARRHRRFAEYVDAVVLRWNFCQVIDDCGVLFGTARSQGRTDRYQEGRLGYEQLAAAGFAAWGFDTRASSALPATQVARIDGLPIRYDARDARATGVQTPVLTMPFVLAGMELGWQSPQGEPMRDPAQAVYEVQAARWKRDHIVTARTDYQLREAPYVALDAVFAAGYPWNTIGNDGKSYEKLALVSTRAAFGMWALWGGAYGVALIDNVRWLHDADRGWYEGRFEAGGTPMTHITLATNAAVLEALLFKARGTLLPAANRDGVFTRQTRDVFQQLNRCTPAERPACTRAP